MASALVETYPPMPLEIVSGRGSRVVDATGREYWDFYGGHAVALLGHAHPAVSTALAAQADRLAFYSNAVPLEIRTRAAERLCAFAPQGLEHVFFCNSGAEANENALKLAIARTGRTRIAALAGGFHGRTLLALSATAGEALRTPFSPLLADCVRLTPNEPVELTRIDATVAAVIVEPIQSLAGIRVLSGDYLRALRQRCDAVGTWLIYDEVQTGMGRCGRPLIAGEHGVLPDLATLAKGIANGVPMGALLMSPRVAAGLRTGDLGSTFGGGPLACAALIAVLETLEREVLVERAARLGDEMHAALRGGMVGEVLGRGGLIGLRLNTPAKPVQRELLSRGFITGTSDDPHVLRLMPPITLPFEAVHALAGALHEMGAHHHASLAGVA